MFQKGNVPNGVFQKAKNKKISSLKKRIINKMLMHIHTIGGSHGKASADFVNYQSVNPTNFMFNQHSTIELNGKDKQTWYVDNTNGSVPVQSENISEKGDVRRSKNFKIYIPGHDNETNVNVLNNDLTNTPEGLLNPAIAGNILAGSLPGQIFRLTGTGNEEIFTRKIGQKKYELKDHLGNVRVVVKDIRKPIDDDDDNVFDHADAQLICVNDYYPFGMQMPGREYVGEQYRFGFNGVEKDDEIRGLTGTNYTFKFREYDPLTGRFWSVDPLASKYPWNSTYAFAENDVIRSIDIEGLEKWKMSSTDGKTTATSEGPWSTKTLDEFSAKTGLSADNNPDETINKNTISPIPYKGEITKGFLNDYTFNLQNKEITQTPNFNMGVGMGILNGVNPLNWFSSTDNSGMSKEYQAGFGFGNFMGASITSIAAPEALAAMTTKNGFLLGSFSLTLKNDLNVSFIASEKSLGYGTFQYSTIAPKSFLSSNFFGRNMLQITTKFQTELGPVINATIPKGSVVNIGLSGYQRGMFPGSWLQLYTKMPTKFK
ncbi:MAG: hypothetical protein A2046_07880 [Bacteroidetes bacterium GWA2_30_7]|nr:MAG: hypothetical protein A2046_07880 [Bacteroidetes bacterium GWA2_30_7]